MAVLGPVADVLAAVVLVFRGCGSACFGVGGGSCWLWQRMLD